MLNLSKFSNHSKWCISHFTRNYKTKIRPDPVTNATSEETIRKGITSRMRKCFEEHGVMNIVNQAPDDYLKRSKYVNYCTAIDPKLAKRIAFSICSRLEDGFVIESDPGFGFMSRVLVSIAPHLFLCEGNKDFRSKLKDLKMKHENVHINAFNVNTLFKMMMLIQEEPLAEVNDLFQDILSKKRDTSDSQRINWIFPCLTRYLMRNLCYLHLCDASFQQLGKMTYSITLPSTMYKTFTEPFSHNVREQNALVASLFQIIFNHELLMTGIPRNMFLPWPPTADPDGELVLIHLVPKDNLFESDMLAKSFLKFLQIGLRRKRRVIPLLEKYVNNCGPFFILEHDMTVYTEFLDLTPENILSLFMSFSKLPEFSHSTFVDEEPDEYSDEAEASEKKLNDDVDNFEDVAEIEDDEENQSKEGDSNESKGKDLGHS